MHCEKESALELGKRFLFVELHLGKRKVYAVGGVSHILLLVFRGQSGVAAKTGFLHSTDLIWAFGVLSSKSAGPGWSAEQVPGRLRLHKATQW